MKLKRIRELNNGVKASIAFAICSALQKGIQIITVPLFTRALSSEQYGEYSLFQSWCNIICIIATLNLSSGCFNNGMMKYPQKRERFISSLQGLSSVLTLVWFLVYLLGIKIWNALIGLPTTVMIAMFIYLLFSPATQFWSGKQRYEYKYKALVLFTLMISVIEPVVGYYAVCRSIDKGTARILAYCMVYALAGITFYLVNVMKGRTVYCKEYWGFALTFNIPLIPHYLSQFVLGQSDRIMIEKLVGKSAVAYYSIAYNIGFILTIFIVSVNASYVPWVFEKLKGKQSGDIAKLSSMLVVALTLVTIIPILFAPEAISIMGTEEYKEAVWVIPPVAVGTFLTFIYALFANIELFYEKSKFVMIATCLAAICNVVLNYCFIPLYGYIAAGYTTLFSYGILALLHFTFMKIICKKVDERDSLFDYGVIMKCCGGLMVLSPVFMLLYRYFIPRYICILALIILMVCKRDYLREVLVSMNRKKNQSE